MDNCGNSYGEKGLYFHLRIKEFLSNLAKEIMENGNLPDSWKMGLQYGLPEVLRHIKVSPHTSSLTKKFIFGAKIGVRVRK